MTRGRTKVRFFGPSNVRFFGAHNRKPPDPEETGVICHLHLGDGCLFCAAVPDEEWGNYVSRWSDSPDEEGWEEERRLGREGASEETLVKYRKRLGFD